MLNFIKIILNTITVLGNLGILWIRFKIQRDIPQRLERLKNESSNIQKEILLLYRKMEESNTSCDVDAYAVMLMQLQNKLSKRECEIKHLSSLCSQNKSGDKN